MANEKPTPNAPWGGQMPPPQATYYNPGTITAAGEAAGSTLKALSPADRSWIAGFIVVVAIIVISDLYMGIKTLDAQTEDSVRIAEFFKSIEVNRATELRRSQETIKALAETLSREAERTGRTSATVVDRAVEEGTRALDRAVEEGKRK